MACDHAVPDEFRRLYEESLPSIVLVQTDRGSGTAFFVDNSGNLLTASHVVSGARKVECITRQGFRIPAEIRFVDTANDLALLRVRADWPGATPLRLSESLDLGSKDRLVTVSHQLGNHRPTLGLGRYTHHGLMPAGTWRVWSSALTREGSSGGPIMRADGTVVALTSAGNPSFTASIPSEQLAEFLAASDPKFVARQRPSGWLFNHWQLVKQQPAIGALDAAIASASGYGIYRVAGRLPRLAGLVGALSSATLGYSDYKNWMNARNDRESQKFLLAFLSDAGMLGGISLAAARRRLGIAALGISAIARIAVEMYPTRTVLQIEK